MVRSVEKESHLFSIWDRSDIENGIWTWTMPSAPATSLGGRIGAGVEAAIEEGSHWLARKRVLVGKGYFGTHTLRIWALRGQRRR